ncbi:MAG TPA: OsmC family protein [Fimbriimonadaceae bacterium]|nr:OsmC family protein [Fimbriimonadaceae bacterium]
MANPHFYRAKLTWTGGEQGPAVSYESYSRNFRIEMNGRPPIEGSADPNYRGDGSRVNPEELLVASISSCHMLTYIAFAVRSRMDVVSYVDEAEGIMQMEGDKMRVTDVILRPKIVLGPGADLEKARALHDQAHNECFIANSVTCSIRVEAEIVTRD